MFERYTDRARRVVVLAQEEARILKHNYIGTEHLLLGLIREGEGVASQALRALGLSREAIRGQVEEIIGAGTAEALGHIPFTSRTKKCLEFSLREALQLGHNYIGTEHVLLGLLREGEGVGAQVLVKLGAELTQVRQQVIQIISNYQTARSYEGSHVQGLLIGELKLLNQKIADTEQQLAQLLGARGEVLAHLEPPETVAQRGEAAS